MSCGGANGVNPRHGPPARYGGRQNRLRKLRKMRKFQKRAAEAPDQRYSTFTISSSSTPAGVRSFTTSPCSARSSALAMGEIQLT